MRTRSPHRTHRRLALVTTPVRACVAVLTPLADESRLAADDDAISADGVWSYTLTTELDRALYVGRSARRLSDGVSCWVEHIPTGLVQTFGTRDQARAWTGSDRAIPFLHRYAVDLYTSTSAFDVGEGRRALTAFGLLLSPHTAEATTRCECGAYLAFGPGRVLTHLDLCVDEFYGQSCPDGGMRHHMCLDPAPVACEHRPCRHMDDVYAQPCETGREACCGRHHGDMED